MEISYRQETTEASALLRKAQAGFTLVELMIVVVILIMLAGVGYPLYMDQVRKARRTDARSAAMQVALAQEQYFTRKGTYTNDLSDIDLNLSRGLETGVSEGGYYRISVAPLDASTLQASFVVTLSAIESKSQKKDRDCKTFAIDQTGKKSAEANVGGDPTKCW